MNITINYPFKFRIDKERWRMGKVTFKCKVNLELRKSKILTLWFFTVASFKFLIFGIRQLWERA